MSVPVPPSRPSTSKLQVAQCTLSKCRHQGQPWGNVLEGLGVVTVAATPDSVSGTLGTLNLSCHCGCPRGVFAKARHRQAKTVRVLSPAESGETVGSGWLSNYQAMEMWYGKSAHSSIFRDESIFQVRMGSGSVIACCLFGLVQRPNRTPISLIQRQFQRYKRRLMGTLKNQLVDHQHQAALYLVH